jgi:acetyl-CoA synthetase
MLQAVPFNRAARLIAENMGEPAAVPSSDGALMNNPNKPVEKVYPVLAETARRAHADKARYKAMYEESVRNPDAFSDREAKRLDWIKPFTRVKNTSFDPGAVSIKWFEDGRLNVSVNCIDRHLSKRGDQTAIIFEGDDPNDSRHTTYLRDRK